MSDVVISVENLGKCYQIKHAAGERERYTALRDVIAGAAAAPFRAMGRAVRGQKSEVSKPTSDLRLPTSDPRSSSEDFWALRDVSFEVKRGEVLGIIGRNGAGKSTLLKILSRITEPTKGRVQIKGRVASLLEVGTGFHPELTGRENIFLNGAILGMSRMEIKTKFDEIVAFAEVEKFLDTPVKRYSSGMYVRLAFAVAAHLEPEILIVDEVLAVGDAQFQKKCVGKMEQVSKGGRTILFVSHNLAAVESLCSRGIVLDHGEEKMKGPIPSCLLYYQNLAASHIGTPATARRDRQGRGAARIESFDVSAPEGLATGKPAKFRITFSSDEGVSIDEFGVSIWSDRDVRLISISSKMNGGVSCLPKSGTAKCTIPVLQLVEGSYYVNAFISSNHGLEDYVQHLARISVAAGDFFGTGRSVDPTWGVFAVQHIWEISKHTLNEDDFETGRLPE